MERRLAAILGADVLGYSRLMEADILMRNSPSSSMQSFIESGHGGHETDLLCLGAQAFKFRHQFCPAPTLPPRCQRPAAGDHEVGPGQRLLARVGLEPRCVALSFVPFANC